MRLARSAVLVALLALALWACGDPQAPQTYPNVAGRWAFTGTMFYGGTMCADTLTMTLSQYGQALSGRSDDWHFWCGASQSDTSPVLRGTGAVRPGDSIVLRWETDPSWENCGSCPVFVFLGRVVDTLMTGRYNDALGGAGTWSARVLP